jgi:hypothetical protein
VRERLTEWLTVDGWNRSQGGPDLFFMDDDDDDENDELGIILYLVMIIGNVIVSKVY